MCLSGDNCLTCELSECLLDKRQRKADARKAATEEAKQNKKKLSDEMRKQKIREYNRRYRIANREKLRLKDRKWRAGNPEKYHESAKRYRENHREEIKERAKKYRNDHIEEARAKARKYYEEHREEIKEKNRNRYYTNKARKANEMFNQLIGGIKNETD